MSEPYVAADDARTLEMVCICEPGQKPFATVESARSALDFTEENPRVYGQLRFDIQPYGCGYIVVGTRRHD